MNHRSFAIRSSGAFVAALLAFPIHASTQDDPSIASWQPVPDAELAQMRGGLDLGSLAANFAIERLVRIDGEIVARTQLLIAGLERLTRGSLPDVRLLGNLANLVQVGSGNEAITDAGSTPSSVAPVAPVTPPATGSSGSVSTTNVANGLSSEFGTALAQAVAIANGEDPPQRPAPIGAVSVPAGASAPAGSQSAQPAPGPGVGGTPAANGAALISISIPMGTGRIVVTGIPNASALATSIQNSVQATRIETETRISATLSSLAAMRSATFAAALRQQAIDSVRR